MQKRKIQEGMKNDITCDIFTKGKYVKGCYTNWNADATLMPQHKTKAACVQKGGKWKWKGQTDPKESEYRGCQNKTKSGYTCQKWTVQNPHKHGNTPQRKPNKGLGNHNYCRNPDGEPGIWCYTTNSKKRWELCDVPKSSLSTSENLGNDSEGTSSKVGKGYLLDWKGKKYMNDCNDFTSSVGPYKNKNGKWLVSPCLTGFNDATGGNANNNSCSKTYKGKRKNFRWRRKACNTGVHLGNFKKSLNAIEENGSIKLVGEQFVTPVRGKIIDMKDDLGKNIKTTRDYTLEFEIKPRSSNLEPNSANGWRNIFQRSFVEPSKINWNVKNAVSPGIFFWPKKGSRNASRLHIDFGFGGGTNNNARTTMNTPRLPINKWTKVKITLKDKSCTVNLSGAINWNKSLKVRVPAISTIDQPYNKPNVKSYFYLSQPKTDSTNARIKNMKWTNHPEKRCFARLPTGCDRALGELNHKQHSEYNKKDTGWIEGGWGWTGT